MKFLDWFTTWREFASAY